MVTTRFGALRKVGRSPSLQEAGEGPDRGMAVNPRCPAFIDPPGPYATLAEWISFRAELARMDVPGLGPFIREADRAIARLAPA